MLGIFLDTETNGLDAKQHKVLEIAFKIVDLMTGKVLEAFEALVAISLDDWRRSDKASLDVNNLSWDMLSQGKSLETISMQVKNLFQKYQLIRGKAVFICQNPSFDRAFFSQIMDIPSQEKLKIPYHWLDLASMYWAYAMHQAKENHTPFPWETGVTKDKIAEQFNIPSEDHPHRAMNGVEHLMKCYEAVIGFPKKAESTAGIQST